jgi:hypothetical protein
LQLIANRNIVVRITVEMLVEQCRLPSFVGVCEVTLMVAERLFELRHFLYSSHAVINTANKPIGWVGLHDAPSAQRFCPG